LEINIFGKTFTFGVSSKDLSDNSDFISEEPSYEDNPRKIYESSILDNANSYMLGDKEVVGIKESVVNASPVNIRKMIESNDIKLGSLLDSLKTDFSVEETFRENEDMAKDTIVGSAMELMADDCCMIQPAYNRIVRIESKNKKLEEFLNTFLDKNVDIETRIWEWAFEIVKHGDFKLRRMEYETSKGKKNVYYENVMEGYKVSRIEYLGTVLGFLDEESEDKKGKPTLESKDTFIHFLSRKLPNRKKVEIKVRDKEGNLKDVTCYKVWGSSLVDNARYIYRVVNLLDNMLVMSRIARSTQYNLVKVEVGNASPAKTQDVMMDVRRRIEGSTRMTKNKGMRSDPSPIPVNSNVYIPVREGKGDITIDSVNESVDVKSIVDIDYFRNKQFAAIRIPQAYLGFEECLHYDTLVPLLDGTCHKIGDMAKSPELFVGKGILSCNADGTIVPTKIVHVKVTRRNASFVRITLDNNETLTCTPDHLIMLRDGTFKEAGSLSSGESLMPYCVRNSSDVYKLDSVCVGSIELLDIIEDAYDLGVENESHSFPVSAGIFVHNSLPGTMGNTSLAKLDMRYARNAQKGQNILRNGIHELCNNYLLFRGRVDDVDEFDVILNNITSAEDASRVEDFISQVGVFDSITTLLNEFKDYVSKPKLMNLLLKMMRINPSDISSDVMIQIVKKIEAGEDFDDLLPKEVEEDEEDF
jgi:hypothetical protein